MSKYDELWKKIKITDEKSVVMSFEEVEKICGFSIDHSFLKYKKELCEYGYAVDKISIKNRTISFVKVKNIEDSKE